MDAQVLVSVKPSLPMEHTDFTVRMFDDAPITVGELRNFGDKDFRHAVSIKQLFQAAKV